MVERLGAAGRDGPQRPGQVGRLPALAGRRRPAVRQELAGRVRITGQDFGAIGDPATDVGGNRHALLRQADGRRPEVGPGQRAVPLPECLVDRDGARHSDRVDPFQRHLPQAAAGVVLARCAGRRGAAPVERHGIAALSVVEHHEGVPAEPFQCAHSGHVRPPRSVTMPRGCYGPAATAARAAARRTRYRPPRRRQHRRKP